MNGVYALKTVDWRSRRSTPTRWRPGPIAARGARRRRYYIERIVDVLAAELGMDPVELRRKNFIPPDAFPYKTPTGTTYDSGDYEKPLAKALKIADYDGAARRAGEAARKQGRYIGIGVATFTEICGFGPFDSASVRVEPSGQVTVATGISPHGQGPGDDLRADRRRQARRLDGRRLRRPRRHRPHPRRQRHDGLARARRRRLRADDGPRPDHARRSSKIVAHKLEAAVADVDFENGKFGVKGAPEGAMTLKEIAKIAYSGSVPAEIGTGLEAADFFAPPGTTFPFGADIVVGRGDPRDRRGQDPPLRRGR